MSIPLRQALAALLLVASPVAFAINMVANPDYDANLDGWDISTQNGGGAYRDFFFGSPLGGTLRLEAHANGQVGEAKQCVDIHKWVTIDFALRYSVNITGTHEFKLEINDAPDCSGNVIDTLYPNEAAAVGVSGNPDPGWLEAGVYDFVLKPGAMSAHIDLSATGTPIGDSSYMIDHVQVGPLQVIFVDDFDAD